MSANNHTPITTGAAANASIVNSPLGQLDAAMGALTGLPTADKTSIVASLVELQASTNTALGGLASLLTADKSSAVAAINELYHKLITMGAYVLNAQLVAWTEAGAYEAVDIFMDTTYPSVVSSANVVWPDGSAGLFYATTIDATWEAINAYAVTHTASGKTVTQAAVTRNTDGLVTTKPILTVA